MSKIAIICDDTSSLYEFNIITNILKKKYIQYDIVNINYKKNIKLVDFRNLNCNSAKEQGFEVINCIPYKESVYDIIIILSLLDIYKLFTINFFWEVIIKNINNNNCEILSIGNITSIIYFYGYFDFIFDKYNKKIDISTDKNTYKCIFDFEKNNVDMNKDYLSAINLTNTPFSLSCDHIITSKNDYLSLDKTIEYIISNFYKPSVHTSNDKIISHKDKIISPKDKIISPKDKIISPKNRIISPKDRITSPKDRIISPKDRIISPKDRIISPKDKIISPKDRIISPKNKIISPKDRIISPKDKIISPKDKIISPQDRIISPQDRIISPKDRIISPKDRIISPKEKINPPKEKIDSSEKKINSIENEKDISKSNNNKKSKKKKKNKGGSKKNYILTGSGNQYCNQDGNQSVKGPETVQISNDTQQNEQYHSLSQLQLQSQSNTQYDSNYQKPTVPPPSTLDNVCGKHGGTPGNCAVKKNQETNDSYNSTLSSSTGRRIN